MRNLLIVAAVVVSMGALAAPAQAQLRSNVPQPAAVKVVEPTSGFSLSRLFSSDVFHMRHSYSLGYSTFGGSGLSMGEYANTMTWNFSPKLAARADIAFAHTPFGTGGAAQMFGGANTYGKLYLRNAEVFYQPHEKVALHLSVQQSPYGRYLSPFGYGGYGYGYGNGYYDPYDLTFDASYGAYGPFSMRRYGGSIYWH